MENELEYKGEIAGFPKEVVKKMLERQFEQTGKRDISVFEENRTSDKQKNGFDWRESIEGYDFWNEVILRQNIYVFYEMYPKS